MGLQDRTQKAFDKVVEWDKNLIKKCQDGTYVWKLIYKDFTQSAYQLTGHVNLIR